MSEITPAPKSLASLQAGTFAYGDRIQLTDPKGKMYSLTITPGKEWHTHKGWIVHDELVGIPEGSVISTTAGLKFTAFKPVLRS
jgi:tRNA (adenine57-N1/adenine58-N1)-methyltransferase